LNEPSVVAVRKGTNQVLRMPQGEAVGVLAKEMLGKTPGAISAIRPLKEGVISDFEITEAMLSYFIRKALRTTGQFAMFSPRVVISVPSGITAVEKRAVYDSAARAGARSVHLCEEPLAAAVGAGLPWSEAQGSMIVDIGGGTSEVAVLSLGDIAVCESIRVAGDDLDEAIISHMKKHYSLTIGEQTAERIKIEIGSAYPTPDDKSPDRMDVRGRDMVSGLPRQVTVTSEEIREALQEPVMGIAECIKRVLERTDPELSADLYLSGLTLAGGGALLRGIRELIEVQTGLKVKIAADPLTCVARGTAQFLDNLDLLKDMLDSDQDG